MLQVPAMHGIQPHPKSMIECEQDAWKWHQA